MYYIQYYNYILQPFKSRKKWNLLLSYEVTHYQEWEGLLKCGVHAFSKTIVRIILLQGNRSTIWKVTHALRAGLRHPCYVRIALRVSRCHCFDEHVGTSHANTCCYAWLFVIWIWRHTPVQFIFVLRNQNFKMSAGYPLSIATLGLQDNVVKINLFQD
jgi:hypothetical protein